jgi:hypothetical protein
MFVRSIMSRVILWTSVLFSLTGCFHFKVNPKEANLWPIPPELKAELAYPAVPIEWFERNEPAVTNYRVLKVSLMLPVAFVRRR